MRRGRLRISVFCQPLAAIHAESALRLSRELGARGTEAMVEGHLGLVAQNLGRLEQALTRGINLIDTSANYADGGSERLVGEILAQLIAFGIGIPLGALAAWASTRSLGKKTLARALSTLACCASSISMVPSKPDSYEMPVFSKMVSDAW